MQRPTEPGQRPEEGQHRGGDVWSLADQWGPEKAVGAYDPDTGMRGVLVIDNTAIGPGKGGIRFMPSVTPREVFRLARVMTWKCALAGLPFGGAKSGIMGDPNKVDRVAWVKAFARAVKPYIPNQYIGAPDIGTTELDMAVFAHEVGDMHACTGKPLELGGIPHELGTTGFGVAVATNLSIKVLNDLVKLSLDPKEATIAVQGFGNVGSFTAKFLYEMGYKIVAVSDVTACVHEPKGLDILRMMKDLREASTLDRMQGHKKEPRERVFDAQADIFIPAATSDVINEATVKNLLKSKVKMVVEAANIPTTASAERVLRERGVLVIPDIVANAGGVIGSYIENQGRTEKDAFDLIEYKVTNNLKAVLVESVNSNKTSREVAEELARLRVKRAMLLRRGAIDAAREMRGAQGS